MIDYSRVIYVNNTLIITTLHPSIFYVRIKYWNRENFRLPVFDGFTLWGCPEHYSTIKQIF